MLRLTGSNLNTRQQVHLPTLYSVTTSSYFFIFFIITIITIMVKHNVILLHVKNKLQGISVDLYQVTEYIS